MFFRISIPLILLLYHVSALWPIPRSLETGTTLLKLADGFDFKLNFDSLPEDLTNAIARAKDLLMTDNLQILVPDHGESNRGGLEDAKSLSGLTLALADNAPAIRPIATEVTDDLHARDESYTLIVPDNGSDAMLRANSSLGLFRGLTTFGQLWYDLDGTTYTTMAPFTVSNDSPAYPYRGLHLDTSRNFFPVSDIKGTLDGMSWVKEIDNPGHTASIAFSHPEHVACFEGTGDVVLEPPLGQLRLASEATLNFTLDVLTAVASKLPSKFFHTGGDELNQPCYNQDQQTQDELERSGRSLEDAIGDWVDATHDRLRSIGKTPIVWEEMVLEHNITLKNDTVALVWISSDHAASVAAKNVRIVHAPLDHFYLVCGAWLGGDLSDWCHPFNSWQKAYTFNPLANISSSQEYLILGGQQLLWTEQSGPENLDPIMWPRAASSAEVFWTGPTLPDGSERVAAIAGRNKMAKTEVLGRIHDLRARLAARGIRAINIQPKYCQLRPERCLNERDDESGLE
ncbi:Glucosamine-6-phosphate isomerase (Glucosamine-6-phosphate deaminase) (GNPDA) (GlcN6P deaminase) [Marasmius tenuissimus]|nr:Glucosamine-6-phosphate isomerase (Glucosamine-6-phosphate deaminase) (GNPDA) (GlcN6P deaminase) [Marasmius tenuissimus]